MAEVPKEAVESSIDKRKNNQSSKTSGRHTGFRLSRRMDKRNPNPIPTPPTPPTSQQQLQSNRGRSLFRSISPTRSSVECADNLGTQRPRFRFQSRRSASTELTTTTSTTTTTKQRTSPVPTKDNVTTKPVKEKAIKIRRSSVSSFFGRLSVGKSQSSATTVYLDGREMGLMTIQDRESAERIRERFLKEIKGFVGQGNFHFWYAAKECHIVEREHEATTKIKDCMDEHHILHCRSSQFMNGDQTIADFNISEERLRDLAPEAESVVRCCFRLLEDTMTPKAINKNADANLPNQAINCVKFIKDVARAAVDSRRTKDHPLPPNVHWEKVQKCLRQLEDLFRDSVKHEGIAVWWFYKTQQKNAKQLIAEIQREFRQSPNLRDDHPVFFVQLKQASPQAEALATTLDKIALDDFISKKHEKTRIKLAAFLSMTEKELRYEILNKKSNILFSHHNEDRAHFCEQNGGLHRNSLMKSLLEKGGLKGILDPLHDFQNEFVDRLAADFQDGTRDWALEAFDTFLAAKNSPHRAFIITGQASSGKSCLAAKLIQTRREIVLGYQFCRHDDYRYREAKSMLLSLSYQLTLQSPHYERRIRSILTDYGMTRKQLLNSERCSIGMIFTELLDLPLSEIPVPPSERYVIVIDGLDEAKRGETGKNEILDAIRELFLRLPNWILFVFTTKPRLNVLKKLRLFNAVMIEPNSKQDAADLGIYFTASLELDNYGSKGDRDLFSQSLIDQAKGNFLYAKIISLKFSEHGAQSDYLSDCMMRDLDGILNLEFDTLTSLEAKNNTILFWSIVKLAMVAIKPLHNDVIKALTGCDDDKLDQVLRSGSTFFALHDSRVRFLHKTVKDWLLQKLETIRCNDSGSSHLRPTRRLSFTGASHKDLLGVGNLVSDEVANCHNFFAERILTITTRNRSGLDGFNFGSHMTRNYVLQHGVHHLALAHRIQEARDIILDPAWLIARAVDPEGIVECCELIGEADQILHLVGRAVTLATDSIRSDPRQLIGQLVGRLMAATIEGHGDSHVRESIIEVIRDLKGFNYGFQWWCPVAQTWHQAEQVFLRKLIGHTAPVQCVAWHSDSRRCASSSWDATIRVWDSQTGTGEQIYTGHTDTVFSIHWETKGNRMVSGSLDRSIKIWNTESEECEVTLLGHTDSVWCVQWSRDNARISSSSKDKTVRIWCSSTGKELRCLTGHEGSVYSVAWEGGIDSRLCSGATDNSVRIWDTTTGNCLQTLDGHKDWIRDVHWGLCGTILSASADHTVRVWTNLEGRMKCQQVLMGHTDCCWSVSMSSDSRYAVSGSTDSTVKVWNLGSGVCEHTLRDHTGPVWSVSWGPDGKRVLSGSSDKCVILWDATVGLSELYSVPGHEGPIWSVDVSRDGNTILTGSSDKTARLWNSESGLCTRVFTGHQGPLYTVRLSNQADKVVTGSSDSTAAIYRISTGERLLVLAGHTFGVWAVVWSPNDRRVFTGSKDNTIRMWCSITGGVERIFEGHLDAVKGLSVSSDGRRLASASTDATLRVWDVVTGECDVVLQRKEAGALCVEWHPDNIRLSAGYTSGCVRVWNVQTGEREIGFLPGHSRRTTTVAWSPNGEKVVSSSTDKEIRIWNTENHCELKIKGHTGLGIFSVKWAKNGNIVSVGTDKSVRIWDSDTGRCVKVLSSYSGGLGVFSVAWSPDGTKVVAGSRDRTVQIYDAHTGKCEAVLTGHTAWVTKVEWEVGGQRVISSSDDGTTRVWTLSGECAHVADSDSRKPADDVMIEAVESKPQNLSGLAKEYMPVGIQCDRVQINGDRAVGWVGQSVYFFELIGEAPIIPAPLVNNDIQESNTSSMRSTDSYESLQSTASLSNHSRKYGTVMSLKSNAAEALSTRKKGRGNSRDKGQHLNTARQLSHDGLAMANVVSMILERQSETR